MLIVAWVALSAGFWLGWIACALVRQPTLDEKEQPK